MRQRLLGSQAALDLAFGVNVHPVPRCRKTTDRLFELGNPVAALIVLVRGGILRGLVQRLDDELRRGHIGITDAEVNDLPARGEHLRLDPGNLPERIRRDTL